MKNQSHSIGKIAITFNKNLSFTILSRIHAMAANLFKDNIEVILRENDVISEYKVIIKVLSIGNISDKQIREALKIFFAGNKEKNDFVKFIDEDKEFYLPADTEECIDWFIIE